MSNNNNNLQTQTSSAFHNAIVEAGGKDRPQMLARVETKKWIDAKAEAVQIILTGIDNDIYSTVDACPNAMEMWKAIKRLKQEWQRFVTLVKQSQELKTVSYHKLYDILKQHQHEVNEISAERLARTANPFALVAQQQPVYYPPPNLTHYTQKPEIVVDEEAFSKEKEIDQLMALISMYFKKIYKPTNNSLKTSSNTRNINVDNTLRPDRRTGDDTNDELEDEELEAHYMYMEKIQEVILDGADNSGPIFDIEPLEKVHNSDDNYNVFANERQQPESVNDTYLVEQCDINTTPDLLDMSNNGGEVDQDDQMLQEERELLVSLIEQMKIEIDGSKQNNKCLESANKALREANTFLNNELKRYKESDFVKNIKLKCAKAYGLLAEQNFKFDQSFSAYTKNIINLNQKLSELENELSAHKRTISTISFQKEEQEKFFKTHEDKEIEKVIISPDMKILIEQKLNPTAKRLTNDVVEFYQTLKEEMVEDFKIVKSLKNEFEYLQSQLKLQQTQFSNEIGRLSREYYYDDHMNAILDAYNNIDEYSGSCGTDLYSITSQEITSPNPIYLMAKASSSHAWLWHHRLSHLNFDTINLLLKNDIVNGLPKLKFVKDHLSSSCELGKAKRKSFKTKTTPSSKGWLLLLRMDLCGPMRVESINGKKYVLVIVDDYSEYTWTHFLRSKDETPKVLIDFLRMIQRGLHAQMASDHNNMKETSLQKLEMLFGQAPTVLATENINQAENAHVDEDEFINIFGFLDTRKSTSSGIQFLGDDKLISWSSNKQDRTSMSTAKAEYVSLSACCAQVLWMRTQLKDYGFHFVKIPCWEL
ncbi:retrovirus-related pol polyprotein from transposon TNT 1-94 [Tanacetum coccineum]